MSADSFPKAGWVQDADSETCSPVLHIDPIKPSLTDHARLNV
jgi:hypothetical protein